MKLFNTAHREEVSATYDSLQVARKTAADIAIRFTQANRALEKAEELKAILALAAMSDSSADKEYQKANAEVGRLKDELDKIAAAQVAASTAVTTAERNLRLVSQQDRVREQTRLGNQLLKHAGEAETAAQALYDSLRKMNDVATKRRFCWPDINRTPSGGLLFERELTEALSHHLYKISARPFVGGGSRITVPPPIPAPAAPWQTNDKVAVPSLIEVVTAANEFLLDAINKLPLPGIEDASATAEPDPAPVAVAPARQIEAVQPQPSPATPHFGVVTVAPARQR